MRPDQGLTTPSPSLSNESFWSPFDDELKPGQVESEPMYYDDLPVEYDLLLTPSPNDLDSENTVLCMPDLSDLIDNDTVNYVYGIIAKDENTCSRTIEHSDVTDSIQQNNTKYSASDDGSSASVNYGNSKPIIVPLTQVDNYSHKVNAKVEDACDIVDILGGQEEVSNTREVADNDEDTDKASECSDVTTESDIESIHKEYKHSGGHNAAFLSKLRSHRLNENRSSSSDSESEDSRPAMVARLPPKRAPVNFVGSGSASSAYNSSQSIGSYKSVGTASHGLTQSSSSSIGTRMATTRRHNPDQSVKEQPTFYSSVGSSCILRDSQSNARCSSLRQSKSRQTKTSTSRHSIVSLDMSKNAIQARINREKKKQYIANLEEQVTELEQENREMNESLSESQQRVQSLAEEVDYLRSILANQSVLSTLIGSINSVRLGGVVNVQGSEFGESSMGVDTRGEGRKRWHQSSADHDYTQQPEVKRSRPETAARKNTSAFRPGLCVHVSEGEVSVQMCRHCAKLSNSKTK